MTREEFAATDFKRDTKVIFRAGAKSTYESKPVDVISVDLDEYWIEVDCVTFCGDSMWVPCEKVDLVK